MVAGWPSQAAATVDGDQGASGLRGVPHRLASRLAARKIPAAIAGGLLAVAIVGVVFWVTGLPGSEQPSPTNTPDEAPPPEAARNASGSTDPIYPVTAIPSDPECQRAVSSSPPTGESSLSDIDDAALTGVVQILTDVGAGSGLVADSAGLIVTDSHVVEGSLLIKVRLASGKTFKGELLGISEDVGVAYIEVTTDDTLTAFPMGDSDEVCVGDAAFAVGFASESLSSGTSPTSTKSRISSKRDEFLWTDASLNPESSGGPLIDSWGNIIGVNSGGIVVNGDTATSSANFAIPINGVKQEIKDGLDRRKMTNSVRTSADSTATP